MNTKEMLLAAYRAGIPSVIWDEGGCAMNIDNLTHEQIQSAANSYCQDEPGFDGAETFPACGSCVVCECRKALSADNGKEDRR